MKTPEGWLWVTLRDVLTSAEYGSSAPAIEGGTRPIVGMSNLRDGAVDFEGLGRIDEAPGWAKLQLREGDILLNRTNSPALVGKVGIVGEDSDAVFASYLVRLNADRKRIDPYFLNYWLNGETAQGVVKRVSTRGVSQANVNPTVFQDQCPVPLPPLAEQRKIAEILRTWDDALDMMARRNEIELRRTQSLVAELFSQNPGERWTRVRLGDAFVERGEVGLGGETLLSVTQDSGVIDQAGAGRKNSSSADRSKYKLVLPGDIAYNTMRMWQGASGLSSMRGIVSPAYTVVTPVGNVIEPRFAAHLFKTKAMKFVFERFSQGLTSDTWNLKFPAFAPIETALPPIETQRAIANLLDESQRLRATHAELEDNLRTQKRGLMQKLLTGEIRVGAEGDNT